MFFNVIEKRFCFSLVSFSSYVVASVCMFLSIFLFLLYCCDSFVENINDF